MQVEQLQARQPVDPEWAEYVAEVLAKHCYYCDVANAAEAIDCAQCGRPLEIVCPECEQVNPNNPGDAECLNCGAPLGLEEYDPQLLVQDTEGGTLGQIGFAPIAASLILITILIVALTKDDPGGTLIRFALAPIVVLAIATYFYIRVKMASGNDQE